MRVSIVVVRAILAELRRRGIASEQLLSELRLDQVALLDLHTRVSFEQVDQLVMRAIALTGDEGLGLTIGSRSPDNMLQILGHLIVASRTMREAQAVFHRYAVLVAEGVTWGLHEQGKLAAFSYECPIGTAATTRFGAECVLLFAARIGSQFAPDPDKRPLEVSFQHEAPSYADRYLRLFGCPVHFGRPRNEIVFSQRLLDIPQLHADATVCSALRDTAERLLRDVNSPRSVAERIRLQLHYQPNLAAVDVAHMARSVGLTRRSLRRRLADEGVSLSGLIDEERCRVACSELACVDASIKQVAERVGFSEPSAFHRAFKRWTGMTPLQYSRTCVSQPELRGAVLS
jgi:AraC-like DNA-binding protein